MTLADTYGDVVEHLDAQLREAVRQDGIDPQRDAGLVRSLATRLVAAHDQRSLTGAVAPVADAGAVVEELVARVAGFGPLQCYLDDPEVEEIWVNDPSRVFVARRGRHELTSTILGRAQVDELVERMLKSIGRRVDLSQPFVDAMLPDGHRLHVVLEGISRGFSAVNIRKVVVRASRLHDLVALDSLSDHAARFLDASVRAGLNIVITGGTQAGKTPFLNCLAASIPGEDRVAVATDAVLKHVVERIAVPGAELIQATVDERLQVSALKKRLGEIEHDEMIVEQGPASLTSKQRQLGQLQEERERTLETLGRLTRRMALGSLLIDRVAVSQERDGRKYLSLEAAVKARRQARERLEALDLDRQREIIRLMLTVRVEPSPQGVRPTKHTARQRVKVTPLDPRTGEELTMQAEPAS